LRTVEDCFREKKLRRVAPSVDSEPAVTRVRKRTSLAFILRG